LTVRFGIKKCVVEDQLLAQSANCLNAPDRLLFFSIAVPTATQILVFFWGGGRTALKLFFAAI